MKQCVAAVLGLIATTRLFRVHVFQRKAPAFVCTLQAVGQGTGRSADVDVWLDGGKLKIPAGTTVWILTHGLQNTSHIWEDHDQFIPERWEEPGIENARPREDGQKGADNGTAKRWMPFLEGRCATSCP